MHRSILASHILHIALVSIVGLVGGYLLFTYSSIVTGQTSSSNSSQFCEMMITDTKTPIRSGYGSPFSFFQDQVKLAMRVLCTANDVTLAVGTGDQEEYIYEYAFQRLEGKWKRVNLSGEEKTGPWIRGSATAILEKEAMEDGTHRVVAYTCKLVQGQWKCGCRDRQCTQAFWQIQEFAYDSSVEEGEEETGSAASGEKFIENPSTFTVEPGKQVSIRGNGFSRQGNKVYFGDELIAEDIPSRNGTTLTFSIPSETVPGHKTIYVEFADGEKMLGSSLWVTKPGVLPPVLERIEPTEGPYGSEVTIYGNNFSSENNTVFMMFSKLEGVASKDGTSITFKLDPIKETLATYSEYEIPGVEYKYPIHMLVSNEGGVSSKSVMFHILPSEHLLK